jgi:hypothetical protein
MNLYWICRILLLLLLISFGIFKFADIYLKFAHKHRFAAHQKWCCWTIPEANGSCPLLNTSRFV